MKTLHRGFTDAEITKAVKDMVILVDTREQKNQHILQYFESKKIPYEMKALQFGDYSCKIKVNPEHFHESALLHPKEVSLETRIVVERKNSIDEIAGNLKSDEGADAKEKNRFERELIKCKAATANMALMLENFSFDRVMMGSERGNYRTQWKPEALIARLNTMVARYNLHLITLNDRDIAGLMIKQVLSRYAYEYLKE